MVTSVVESKLERFTVTDNFNEPVIREKDIVIASKEVKPVHGDYVLWDEEGGKTWLGEFRSRFYDGLSHECVENEAFIIDISQTKNIRCVLGIMRSLKQSPTRIVKLDWDFENIR